MSMRIDGNQNPYRTKEEEKVREMQKNATAEPLEEKKEAFAPKDEYIGSEKSEKPTGLYHLGRDEEGNQKVYFDAPRKSETSGEEKCTTNTDKVEREIRKLKEEAKALKQQIKSSDEEEKKRLMSKLAQVETELSQKDNDGYRKANASVSNE